MVEAIGQAPKETVSRVEFSPNLQKIVDTLAGKISGGESCYLELAQGDLENTISRVVSEKAREVELKKVQISIKDRRAEVSLTVRPKVIPSDLDISLTLENAKDKEGEIEATSLEVDPKRVLFRDTRSRVEPLLGGRKVNGRLDFFQRCTRRERGGL